jgi:hypothetical protein
VKNSLTVLMIVSCLLLGVSVQSAEPESQKIRKEAKILDRPLIPTGYGITKLLKKDYYLGQLSIDKSAIYRTPEDLVFIDAARRMEFKFVSERKISGRTFGRQLAEGMKINNDSAALKDKMSMIKRFKSFFKKTIIKGDVIRFDYHGKFGTRVYQNKRLLGEISESREFYRFLLNIWLGERPPSSKFKSGLLGQNGDEYAIELQQRYESI